VETIFCAGNSEANIEIYIYHVLPFGTVSWDFGEKN
jgi:hypothetical protein